MASLSNLNDKQNHLLTQLSYVSDKISGDTVSDSSLSKIYTLMENKNSKEAKRLKECIDAGLGDLVIKDVANNKTSGFGAIAFEDSQGNVGITYRGTDGLHLESINDWLDNAEAAITGTSYQSAEAEAFYQKNCDKNGNNYLYGHSKGGNLTQSVFANHYDEIKKVHNLNPQPINPYSLTPDQIAALNSDKLDVVVTEGDYVRFLGTLAYDVSKIRVMDNSCGDDAHSYSEKRYDDNGKIISGKQPVWEYAAYGAISVISNKLQRGGAALGLVYNTAVRVIDFVKNDFIPAATSLVNKLVDKAKQIYNATKETIHQIDSYFKNLIHNVKDWWNRSFNSGYKYADSNPYIVINTNTMNSYADQLARLSQRAKSLDRRMNSLYWKLGIEWDTIANLGRLLKAEVVLDFAYRLDKNVNYLRTTASEFDRVEREIGNMVG